MRFTLKHYTGDTMYIFGWEFIFLAIILVIALVVGLLHLMEAIGNRWKRRKR